MLRWGTGLVGSPDGSAPATQDVLAHTLLPKVRSADNSASGAEVGYALVQLAGQMNDSTELGRGRFDDFFL